MLKILLILFTIFKFSPKFLFAVFTIVSQLYDLQQFLKIIYRASTITMEETFITCQLKILQGCMYLGLL